MGKTRAVRQQLGKRLRQRIAERRKSLDWTQDQLPERLRVDSETVYRFEHCVTAPALVSLDKLVGVLKTSIADLLAEVSACPTDQAIRISA
jgi:transcriptional regulator with XRE-family HTH domain